MQQKLNCWEHKKCGREDGGLKASEMGVCPAAKDRRLDGVHGGSCGGRSCWMLGETNCDHEAGGNPIRKMRHCTACDFYNAVFSEERSGFQMTAVLLKRLKMDASTAQLLH